MSVAIENLSVTDPAQRANALEVIESVGMRDVVRPLLSIWEGTPQRIDRGAARATRRRSDDWIRACVELAAQHVPSNESGGTMTVRCRPCRRWNACCSCATSRCSLPCRRTTCQPIAAIAPRHAYEDGETIAEQGEPGEEMHIIVSGEVSVLVRDATGEGARGRSSPAKPSGRWP